MDRITLAKSIQEKQEKVSNLSEQLTDSLALQQDFPCCFDNGSITASLQGNINQIDKMMLVIKDKDKNIIAEKPLHTLSMHTVRRHAMQFPTGKIGYSYKAKRGNRVKQSINFLDVIKWLKEGV